jgi:hypothetical protein
MWQMICGFISASVGSDRAGPATIMRGRLLSFRKYRQVHAAPELRSVGLIGISSTGTERRDTIAPPLEPPAPQLRAAHGLGGSNGPPECSLCSQQVTPHGARQVCAPELPLETAREQRLLPRPDYGAMIGVIRETLLELIVCEDRIRDYHTGVSQQPQRERSDHCCDIMIESCRIRHSEQRLERLV